MDVAAAAPERVRGLVLSGATAEPTGVRSVPYRGLAWVLRRLDGPRLDALNRWFFRTRFPASIAEPIVAGGFWSSAGADALRSLAGERFAPRLAAYPGPTLILNGAVRPAVPVVRGIVRQGRPAAPAGPPGGRHPPRQPGPSGGLRPRDPFLHALARGRGRGDARTPELTLGRSVPRGLNGPRW